MTDQEHVTIRTGSRTYATGRRPMTGTPMHIPRPASHPMRIKNRQATALAQKKKSEGDLSRPVTLPTPPWDAQHKPADAPLGQGHRAGIKKGERL